MMIDYKSLIPECFGERHLFVLMSFLAIAINYAMRFTLPIAIVAMVRKGVESCHCLLIK